MFFTIESPIIAIFLALEDGFLEDSFVYFSIILLPVFFVIKILLLSSNVL